MFAKKAFLVHHLSFSCHATHKASALKLEFPDRWWIQQKKPTMEWYGYFLAQHNFMASDCIYLPKYIAHLGHKL